MDVYPFGVQLTWEKEGAPTTSVVFERNGPLPSTKSLTFYRYLLSYLCRYWIDNTICRYFVYAAVLLVKSEIVNSSR